MVKLWWRCLVFLGFMYLIFDGYFKNSLVRVVMEFDIEFRKYISIKDICFCVIFYKILNNKFFNRFIFGYE